MRVLVFAVWSAFFGVACRQHKIIERELLFLVPSHTLLRPALVSEIRRFYQQAITIRVHFIELRALPSSCFARAVSSMVQSVGILSREVELVPAVGRKCRGPDAHSYNPRHAVQFCGICTFVVGLPVSCCRLLVC